MPRGMLAFRQFSLHSCNKPLPSNTEAGTCSGMTLLVISVRARLVLHFGSSESCDSGLGVSKSSVGPGLLVRKQRVG